MKGPIRLSLLALSMVLLVSPTILAQQVQSQGPASPVQAPPIFTDGNCADSTGVGPVEIFAPEKTWTSANPCFVSCPGGGFIDCSWSWAGDPKFCCWKTSTRCMSYNCNTGAIALSKQCL